jgi:predicted nucleic acid-binding protein
VVVVADTTPLHYLILIEQVDVLPALFGVVQIAPAVLAEMSQSETPNVVRDWAAAPPAWLQVRSPIEGLELSTVRLGPGERDSLALALEAKATLVLMDDRAGRREAQRLGIATAGTLRVLASGAERGLLDLREAISRLRATSFRASEGLLQAILQSAARRR